MGNTNIHFIILYTDNASSRRCISISDRQLFAKTIIVCGFGIAKAIIIIAYFFIVSEGGVFNLAFPTQDYTINFTIDISIILLMIIAVNLLGIAKNLFEAINILNKNSTNPLINHKEQ
ncbi:MAG: hypothetical protein P8Y18_03925 [Candidatus Bathyarchaeota archaeon]